MGYHCPQITTHNAGILLFGTLSYCDVFQDHSPREAVRFPGLFLTGGSSEAWWEQALELRDLGSNCSSAVPKALRSWKNP